MAVSEYGTFGEVRKRLDEIVVQVRDKNLSLEKSLDLYEEAIKLGNRCAELVDKADYTEEEALAAAGAQEDGAPADGAGAGEEPEAGNAPEAASGSQG